MSVISADCYSKSRQAFHQRRVFLYQRAAQAMLALDQVTAIRREIPGLGTKKLYLLLREPLQKSGITMGRDRLHKLFREHRLLIRHKRSVPKTTHSNHLLRKYPNLIKQLPVLETEQVWVCDMTYIYVGFDFNYPSLITDAYSKKIVGYCLHQFLSTEGCLKALEMALATRTKQDCRLIHHSDRGVQYCSFEYVKRLRAADIAISMTDSGEASENQIAERVNGILKHEFRLNQVFKTHMEALLAVEKGIRNYNTLRPHMSCSYLTPSQAHQVEEPLVKERKSKSSVSGADVL
ncbi:IS3 family transposase [Rufibacter sediminis]|uniref:IS3 family transposase n=1 Tax=Rufibacter sediminis TaxID=2762756 RepID=A0ABR6VQ69_9BACT|nr:IS3 family transposase [Rufibacter sediminis]MBC3539034.1 IS3 family transposase [Rufibacter sediminis]